MFFQMSRRRAARSSRPVAASGGGGVIEMLEDRRLLAAHAVATVTQHPPATLTADAASPWVVRPADVAANPVAAAEGRPLPGESGHPWVFQAPVTPTRDSQFGRASTVSPTGGSFITTARPPQANGSPYLPYVDFIGGGLGAMEGYPPTPESFTALRSSEYSDYPLTVNYTLGGTADYGSDYTVSSSPNTITFAPGELAKQVTVTPTNDGIPEGQESITAVPLPGPNYNAGQGITLYIVAQSLTLSPTSITLGRPAGARPTGTTTATLAGTRGADYKIKSVTRVTAGTPNAAAATFGFSQSANTAGGMVHTLTITYGGKLPVPPAVYTYDLVVLEQNSGLTATLRVII